MKKKGLLLAAALVVVSAGSFSTSAIASSSAGMSMSGCSAPDWWPAWLPYYCKER